MALCDQTSKRKEAWRLISLHNSVRKCNFQSRNGDSAMRLMRGKVRLALLPLLFLLPVVAGCGSGGGGSTAIVNGKGCMKVGVLLPETATSARWEANDHP